MESISIGDAMASAENTKRPIQTKPRPENIGFGIEFQPPFPDRLTINETNKKPSVFETENDSQWESKTDLIENRKRFSLSF